MFTCYKNSHFKMFENNDESQCQRITRRSKYFTEHHSKGQADLYKRTNSAIIILIESPRATSYLIAIVIVPHLWPFERDSQSKCAWPWAWPFEWVKVTFKYAIENTHSTSYLTAIVMIALSFYRLWDIHSQNVHDLDRDL